MKNVPDKSEILAGIREVAVEHLDWKGELSPELRLIEDLQLDSIRLLTLAVEVENRFQVALDEHDEAGLTTIADLIAVVERRLGHE